MMLRPWHAPARPTRSPSNSTDCEGVAARKCAARSVKSATLVLGLNSGRERFFKTADDRLKITAEFTHKVSALPRQIPTKTRFQGNH